MKPGTNNFWLACITDLDAMPPAMAIMDSTSASCISRKVFCTLSLTNSACSASGVGLHSTTENSRPHA